MATVWPSQWPNCLIDDTRAPPGQFGPAKRIGEIFLPPFFGQYTFTHKDVHVLNTSNSDYTVNCEKLFVRCSNISSHKNSLPTGDFVCCCCFMSHPIIVPGFVSPLLFDIAKKDFCAKNMFWNLSVCVCVFVVIQHPPADGRSLKFFFVHEKLLPTSKSDVL